MISVKAMEALYLSVVEGFTMSWMTIDQVASAVGVSKATISRAIAAGELPHSRFSERTVRVSHGEFGQWVARCSEKTSGAISGRSDSSDITRQ